MGFRATRMYATSGTSRGDTARNASFINRLARLRSTDSPTLREAVNPAMCAIAGVTNKTISVP